MLDKSTVKGPQGVEAHDLADLGDRKIDFQQMLSGHGDPQGDDIIVETDMQFVAHDVGDVIFADMKLLFQHPE